MHPRNRSPGTGYRSNSMGMGGVATASKISPETSMRGHGGGYTSDYRSYNRGGFGRGQSRNFQRSQTPQQKCGDIFMEAGRLATEFLVSKGLLPANVLSGKWQNDSLKNHIGSQEGDGVHSLEGRTSALSRLGGPVSDIGPGRRRYPDEYNSIGSRSYNRGRRRNGSFKNYGSDWGREFGRSGSWSERSRASADADGDSDAFSRHPDDQQVSNEGDSVSQNSPPELAPESDVAGDTESALEKHKAVEDVGAKVSSSSNSKDISMDTDMEPTEKDDVIRHAETGEINDDENNDEMEIQDTKNEPAVLAGSQENSIATDNSCDLLKLCSFIKVPTRPRSSVAIRNLKLSTDPMVVDENRQEIEPPKESRASVEDLTDCLSGNDSSKYPNASKILDDSPTVEAAEEGFGMTYNIVQGNSGNSIPCLDRSSLKEGTDELPEYGKANALMDQGEKRALDDDFTLIAGKRPRESAHSENAPSDGCLHPSDSLEKQQTPQASMISEVEAVTLPSDEKKLMDMSLYPKSNIEPCMEYAEEKELFPGSFKTCDLNLMETSDVNESHNNDPVLIFPSIPASGRQAIPVDIDLTMSNNSHMSSKYGKDIEVIDLENDSIQEDKDFNNVERRTEDVFPGLDGYSSNVHNANDIPDAQDGYGLMFPELLGNDIPNCSSVPPDLNPLHNDMGLHHGEGILGDDESIYMSLGEIPLSLLRVWEQPSQDYGKPF